MAGQGHALTDIELGNIVVQLALEFPHWIERRVERMDYLDRRTTRITVGVMFRWPEESWFAPGTEPTAGDTVYVPLELTAKDRVDSRDGARPDGSPLPIVPFARATRLAYRGMLALVRSRAEDEARRAGRAPADRVKLEAKTRSILEQVIVGPPEHASMLARAALRDPSEELHRLLPALHPVRGLLTELAANEMLLVPIDFRPGEEVVYRYSCVIRKPEREEPLAKRFRDRLLFRDLGMKHTDLPFGWSRSYHFEVAAPEELEIPRATLDGEYQRGTIKRRIAESGGQGVIDLQARRPTERVLHEDSEPPTRSPVMPATPDRAANAERWLAATTEAKPTPPEREDRGTGEVWFRLKPTGTFLVVTVISVLTVVLLAVSSFRLEQLEGQTGATLLLALPGLTLGYMTKPGEHMFATRLLGGIRLAALIVGLCALAAAWMLVGGFVHRAAPTRPLISCEAQILDQAVRPAPHKTWSTTRDPDDPQLSCKSTKSGAGHTTIAPFEKDGVPILAGVSGLVTVWLLFGLAATARRGDGMRREAPAVEPPSTSS